MSIPQRSKLRLSLRQWKTKAITRREQLEALKKRLEELTLSRDTWKGKAQADHDKVVELQATVKRLQAEVASLHTKVTACQAESRELRTQVADLQEETRRGALPVAVGKKIRADSLSA
jgi:uncharacterized coiled-coil DUF342 family protein